MTLLPSGITLRGNFGVGGDGIEQHDDTGQRLRLGTVVRWSEVLQDKVLHVLTRNTAGDRSRLFILAKPCQRVRAQPPASDGSGFVVCVDTLCQGVVPVVMDQAAGDLARPVVYASERDAQLEVIDNMMTRLKAFVEGSIDDFDDVTSCSEFVLPSDHLELKDYSL